MSLDLTEADLQRLAASRTRRHLGSATTRDWVPDREYKGIYGEYLFARAFGLPFNGDMGQQGDGRQDNRLRVGTLRFDVKTSEAPFLYRDEGKEYADILVMCHFDPARRTGDLAGWQFDYVLTKIPPRPTKYGPLSHIQPIRALRPMQELHDWVDALRATRGPRG